MRLTYFLIAIAGILTFSACKKDSDGIQLQTHDQNRLMDTMHAMMSRMESRPKTNDPEIDFLKMMIVHHEGAISMAKVELEAGKDDSLKRTAQKVINDQQAEIEELKTILNSLSTDNTDPAFTMEQMDNMKKGGKAADVQMITGDIDNDFATLMIIHHQGAIDNSSAYLHHGNNSQIKVKATSMINMQTMEIQELADWLLANRR